MIICTGVLTIQIRLIMYCVSFIFRGALDAVRPLTRDETCLCSYCRTGIGRTKRVSCFRLVIRSSFDRNTLFQNHLIHVWLWKLRQQLQRRWIQVLQHAQLKTSAYIEHLNEFFINELIEETYFLAEKEKTHCVSRREENRTHATRASNIRLAIPIFNWSP